MTTVLAVVGIYLAASALLALLIARAIRVGHGPELYDWADESTEPQEVAR